MSATRKIALVAATAVAALGFGAPAASASIGHVSAGYGHDWEKDGEESALLNVSENNIGPFQICHNDIPINAVGIQVPINDLAAALGLLGSDGNAATQVKTCNQNTAQDN